MAYPALVQLASETEYRTRFEAIYCTGTVQTFDGIAVRFRKHQFDHCFFESSRRDGAKDQFSTKRAERIDWIKAALEDSNGERYHGWDKKRKRYDASRRVTIVMGNYVVVIALKGQQLADFVTAYVADKPSKPGRPSTVDMIRRGPRCA